MAKIAIFSAPVKQYIRDTTGSLQVLGIIAVPSGMQSKLDTPEVLHTLGRGQVFVDSAGRETPHIGTAHLRTGRGKVGWRLHLHGDLIPQ